METDRVRITLIGICTPFERTRHMRKVIPFFAVFALAQSLLAADPIIGTWKLNIGKSTFSPVALALHRVPGLTATVQGLGLSRPSRSATRAPLRPGSDGGRCRRQRLSRSDSRRQNRLIRRRSREPRAGASGARAFSRPARAPANPAMGSRFPAGRRMIGS